jgi:acetyl-CoA carboxylase carboxyl transferase subunit alpha
MPVGHLCCRLLIFGSVKSCGSDMFQVSEYMHSYLEFEKPVADIEGKIQELRALAAEDGEAVHVESEIDRLKTKSAQTLKDIYAKLTPWQKTLVARQEFR